VTENCPALNFYCFKPAVPQPGLPVRHFLRVRKQNFQEKFRNNLNAGIPANTYVYLSGIVIIKFPPIWTTSNCKVVSVIWKLVFFSWRKQKLFEDVTNNVSNGSLQSRNTVQDPDLTFLPYPTPANWTITHTYTRSWVLVKKNNYRTLSKNTYKTASKPLPFPFETFGTARYRYIT
jgi:hypothetical protein